LSAHRFSIKVGALTTGSDGENTLEGGQAALT
jgi:hypothetical protein